MIETTISTEEKDGTKTSITKCEPSKPLSNQVDEVLTEAKKLIIASDDTLSMEQAISLVMAIR